MVWAFQGGFTFEEDCLEACGIDRDEACAYLTHAAIHADILLDLCELRFIFLPC